MSHRAGLGTDPEGLHAASAQALPGGWGWDRQTWGVHFLKTVIYSHHWLPKWLLNAKAAVRGSSLPGAALGHFPKDDQTKRRELASVAKRWWSCWRLVLGRRFSLGHFSSPMLGYMDSEDIMWMIQPMIALEAYNRWWCCWFQIRFCCQPWKLRDNLSWCVYLLVWNHQLGLRPTFVIVLSINYGSF